MLLFSINKNKFLFIIARRIATRLMASVMT
jgi:hypothetical protein